VKLNALEVVIFLLPIPILFTAFSPPESRSILLLRLIGSIAVVWLLLVIDRYIQNPVEASRAQARGETDFDPSWGNLAAIVFGWIPASIVTGIAWFLRYLWFRYVRS
jgi:hypothetical protein